MIRFKTTIHKFEKQGEKTGWTYIEIPADLAQKLKKGNKRSFRVKGKLDHFKIKGVALLPMGGGSFIMAFNQAMRKGTGKRKGAMIDVQLEEDAKPYQLNKEFMECLTDDPAAIAHFKSLPVSYQNYYSKWVESAKTEPTRVKRIAKAVNSLSRKQSFAEMLQNARKNKDEGLPD